MYYDFHVLSEDNQIIYENKVFHDGLDIKNNSTHIKKFLDENIFKIEKKFNIYIKDIYLILNDKDLISINVSLIKDFERLSSDYSVIQGDLSIIKESVLKSNLDFELVHMVISKFIIDKKDYFELPEDINQKNFLEIKLICLKKEKLIDLKKNFIKLSNFN